MTNNKRQKANDWHREIDLIGSNKHMAAKQVAPGGDDDEGRAGAAAATGDPARWWRRTRIHVALLGMAIGAVNCYAQATFCIAIVEMILPADYVIKGVEVQPALVGNSSLIAKVVASAGTSGTTTTTTTTTTHLDDHSCPIELKYRDYYDDWRFPSHAISATNSTLPSTKTIDISDRFDWDSSQQGLLLGAFAIGTAPLQVFGGRLAETYGAKWVLVASCLGTALTNLSIPLLARFSFGLLLVNRIVMGVAQAGMEPGLMCLLAEWLTPRETGLFISMLLFAMCAGFFLGSIGSTCILVLGYGWPLAYYVSGGLNLAVGLLWLAYADSSPALSRHISAGELHFVQQEQASKTTDAATAATAAAAAAAETATITTTLTDLTTQPNQDATTTDNGLPFKKAPLDISTTSEHELQQRQPHSGPQTTTCPPTKTLQPPSPPPLPTSISSSQAPWRNILTTRSVWAFIICKFSVRWCADVMGNMLPLYFADVLHLSIKLNGTLNSISGALFAICSFVTGWLVNELIAKQTPAIMDKTALRKVFQSIASFGSALSVFLMTRYDCDIVFSMTMLLVVSCLLVMGTGGELQIPYDMTSKYPGTLHGMACTLSVSGWLAPPLIGLILGDQRGSRHRWSMVWYLTATINLIGGLVFVLFADASPRDFDTCKGSSSKTVSVDVGMDRQADDDDDAKDNDHSGGYYNMACKPQDNSPPLFAKRLSSSSSGSSYRDQKLIKTQEEPAAPTQIQHSTSDDNGESLLYFDRKLLKIRQTEDSSVELGRHYPAHLDSPLATCGLNLIPYREKKRSARLTTSIQSDTTTLQGLSRARRGPMMASLIKFLANSRKGTAKKPAETIGTVHANGLARRDNNHQQLFSVCVDNANADSHTKETPATNSTKQSKTITHL